MILGSRKQKSPLAGLRILHQGLDVSERDNHLVGVRDLFRIVTKEGGIPKGEAKHPAECSAAI
jgi:hypothetical protein